MSGRIATWRVALRAARRDAVRARGRSLLVAALVGLPVLAAGAVDVVYRSDQLDPVDQVTVTLGAFAQARLSGFAPGSPIAQSVDGQNQVGGFSTGIGGITSRPSATGAAPATIPLDQALPVLRSHLPARDRLVRDLTWSPRLWIRAGDRALPVDVRELDYTDPGLTGLFRQVTGRAPEAPGEVVLTTTAADTYRVGVGARLTLPPGAASPGSPERTLTVVGLVRGTQAAWSDLIARPADLVPGDVAASDASAANWYVTGPDPVDWDRVLDLNQLGVSVVSRAVLLDPPPPDRVPFTARLAAYHAANTLSVDLVGIVVVAVGLVLLQVALMAGPALAVGARRNRRALALIAATGGQRRQLRTVVLANALVVGLSGTVAAVVAGAGIGAGLVGPLHDAGHTDAPRVDLHVIDLVALVAVGTLTTLAAALVPARQAAGADVVATLNGRRGQAPPQLRVPVTGLLVALAGAGLALRSAATHSPFLVVLGIAIGEIGLVTAVGAVISLAARFASRLPVPARLALRDAARQRGRTAPAVAAVMAALAGATAASLYLSAQDGADRHNFRPVLATGAVQVSALNEDQPPDATDLARVRAQLPHLLPVRRAAALQLMVSRDGRSMGVDVLIPPDQECPATAGEPPADDPRCNPYRGRALLPHGYFVDDGSAAAALTGSAHPDVAAALRDGRVVVPTRQQLWPDGTVHLRIFRPEQNGQLGDDRPVVLPGYVSDSVVIAAQVLIPPSRVRDLAAVTRPIGLVAGTTRTPTPAEEQRSAAVLQGLSLHAPLQVQIGRGYVSTTGIALVVLVIAALAVALIGTFTAVGLAAAEGRADIATLAAVGAGPGLRRRLGFAQALVISALGAVLGLTGGVLAGAALIRLRQPEVGLAGTGWFGPGASGLDTGWHLVLPWPQLGAIGIGVPIVAGTAGFLLTRSRLPLVRRLAQ